PAAAVTEYGLPLRAVRSEPALPPEPRGLAGPPVRVELDGWAGLDDVLEALGDPEGPSGPEGLEGPESLEGPERPVSGVAPTFEELGVGRGLVRYRVAVPGPRIPYPLTAAGLRDRAVVYVDGVWAGVLTEESPTLPEPVAGPAEVELWVESLGRVNYGPRLGEPKGITAGVLHERQYLHGVRARGLRLDAFEEAGAVAGVPFGPVPEGAGATGLFRGTFTVGGPEGVDHAGLRLPGWTRGFVWVNGFCLGRYWSVGPQETLYVPGPVLRQGADGVNELWVLELEGAGEAWVELGPGAPVRSGTP
ncbi:beta-galactosidase, partial [Streptomyces cavourensis]|nr:beta-galactosidase [Streptomyces cavourensis]